MTDDAGSYSSGAGGGSGNDWELVSLTASTYAAAPGPVLPLLLDAHNKTELPPAPPAAASAIFMSQHFNLPAEVKEESSYAMLPRDDEGATDNLNIPCPENCVREQDGSSMICCSDFHKDLSTTSGLNGGNLFTDVANALPLQGGGGGAPVRLAGEERQVTMLCSSAPPGFDETQPDAAGSDHVRRTSVHHHVSAADAATCGIMGSASLPAHVVHMGAVPSGSAAARVAPNKDPSSSRIPREAQAWWNKAFRFLRDNSKESLTFRFVFVAATIVGLAILGQREKLQLRLEFNVDGEKISCGSEPLALGQVKVGMLGGSPIA